jgi:peptide/nickel transport system permease protein
MKGLLRLLGFGALTVVGAILIGSLPGLFQSIHLNGASYTRTIRMVCQHLIHPGQMTYTINGITRSIYPMIFGQWTYSLILLFCGFCVAFVLATMLAFGTMLLPSPVIRLIKGVLFFLESIPDLLIIITIQLAVISIYQRTHTKLFDIYSFSHPIYVLPILTLAILPAIMIYRMLVLEIEEEGTKEYVDLAKSKGLGKTTILFRHIFRNTLLKTLTHAHTILFFMLSNLLIVEIAYNSQGLLNYVYENQSPDLLTFALLLFLIPMVTFLTLCQILVKKMTGATE